MRKIIFFLCTTLIVLTSCKQAVRNEGYEIKGLIKNVPDSTIVYLGTFFKPVDSTFIIQERFQFTGKVENPKTITLKIKDTRDYAEFWLENRKINFTADKGRFMDRIITGSEIQKQADVHFNMIKPLKKEFESLYQKSMDPKLDQKERDSAIMKYSKLIPQIAKISEKFVNNNPSYLESVRLLNLNKRKWGKEKCDKYFSKMPKEVQESASGKEIAYYLNLPKTPKVGEKFIDFSLPNSENKELKVSDIKGKYTLVEFWSSWCGPCRKSNPDLVKEYLKYNEKGFEIIGVSFDQDRSSWIKALKQDSLIWPNVIDPKGFKGDVSLIYDLNGIPDNFLMDENGIILERRLRGDRLKNKLKDIFQVSTNP